MKYIIYDFICTIKEGTTKHWTIHKELYIMYAYLFGFIWLAEEVLYLMRLWAKH